MNERMIDEYDGRSFRDLMAQDEIPAYDSRPDDRLCPAQVAGKTSTIIPLPATHGDSTFSTLTESIKIDRLTSVEDTESAASFMASLN